MQHRTPPFIAIIAFVFGIFLRDLTALPAHAEGTSDTPCSTSTETSILQNDPEPSAPEPIRLRLSSLYPDPAGDDMLAEFIEIENYGSTEANIDGWSIKNTSGKTYVFATIIPVGGTNSISYAVSKVPLANSGGTITLFDPSGVPIDTVTYAAAKISQTYDRSADGGWAWSGTESAPTPLSTSVPSLASALAPVQPVPLPSLRILRFLPDPAGSDDTEWIDIENTDGTTATIDGWHVDDEEGGSDAYRIPTTSIPAHGTLRIQRSDSGIALNNDGDSVRLIAPGGTVHEAVTYGPAPEGASYSRTETGWEWPNITVSPTPAKEEARSSTPEATTPANTTETAVLEAPELPPDTLAATLSELEGMETGTELMVEGIVTLPPGIAGKSIFALQDRSGDAGAFAQIFGTNTHALAEGDLVRVIGSLRARAGRNYIATTAAKMTVIGSNVPQTRDVAIDTLSSAHDGVKVALLGTLTKRSSLTATISDESLVHEIEAKIPKDALKNVEPGTKVALTGIIRRNETSYEMFTTRVAVVHEETMDIAAQTLTSDTSDPINGSSHTEQAAPDIAPPPPIASSGFSWAAFVAAGSTVAAVVFGKKRLPLA